MSRTSNSNYEPDIPTRQIAFHRTAPKSQDLPFALRWHSILEQAVQKETFLFNTHLEITQNNSEIKKLTELMKNDEEIITLRNNIKKSAQAKVANGTLTVTEMLREVTAENIAMQDKILHEIQLLSAIYELKYTTNQYENK